MINIKSFIANQLFTNCYVVSDETKETCIIDCGCYSETEWIPIREYIKNNDLKPVHLLCTHLHFDHIMGCGFAGNEYNLQTEGSLADMNLYNNLSGQLAQFGLSLPDLPALPVLKNVAGIGPIEFGNHQFTVIATPGHSRGGLCFYCEEENVLFSGDTLFQSSIGRTDLEGGDYEQIIRSITEKLLVLPAKTQVFPGHGPSTTIDYETKFNPYI